MPMRDQIADAAKFYRRSMNSEIIARLQNSFAHPNPPKLPDQSRPPGVESDAHRSTLNFVDGLRHDLTDQAPRQLSYSIHDNNQNALAPEERQLLQGFRALSPDKRAALLEILG